MAHWPDRPASWAIQQAARQAAYFISIANVPPSDASSIQDAVTRLRQQRVDGILSFTPTTTARTALRDVPTAIPLVAIGATTPSRAIGPPTVGIDNRAGAALATRHLLALGHHTVHHVAGPPDCPEASERTTGWRHALRAAGRPVPQARTGDWSAASGYRAGELLIADSSVTAIFCGNDQMAIGVLHALHASGRSVPGNVSVVGFDDLPETAFLLPPLTTIRHDFAEIGRRSIHLLIRQITDDVRNLTIPTAISPRLVVRSSTAPPPVSSSNV
jgi:DNA-binding LacI/PurR family transcriptional regulator